jgi:nicotinamide phosphoribosyltransferase
MTQILNAMLLTDGYKLGHKLMYPQGMTKLYSNFTPRSNKHFPDADKGAVVFGISYFVQKYLIDEFNNNFFNQPKDEIINSYKNLLNGYLGEEVANQIGTEHISALHDLGYLPIEVKGLTEGVYCPYGVPMLTITNTHPDFAWLTNYLETLLSNVLWKPVTSATIADVFKRQLINHAQKNRFL